MTNNMNFSYQDKSYDISLKPIVESSDKTVTVDGRAYQVLGSEEAVVFFKSQVEKIGTTDFENFDSLEVSLKQIGDHEGSKQEKIDSVFQKTIDISNEKTTTIIDKNIGSIDIPDTIKEIGKKLEQYYIFPAIAKKCSEYLQLQLKSGSYEKFSDLKSFADAVTNDLRKISKDKHMTFDLLEELSVKQIETEKVISYSTPDLAEKSYEYKSDHFKGFSYELKSGCLKDDPTIGYLDLRTMGICKTGDDDSIEVKKDGAERSAAFIKAVDNLKGTKSIIIDLRNNGGGTPNAVQLLCSLFMEEGTHLDGIEWRKGDSYQVDTWDALPYEDLPKENRLLEKKVVILISPNTFSAAESCANSMRVAKGATIVGERSKGGANPGGYEPIGKYFDIRIPSGRAINPLQEGNWEGVGIIPDHEVSAKDALNMAISL